MRSRLLLVSLVVVLIGPLSGSRPAAAGPADGLVAFYPLDADVDDASGMDRHGTPLGSPIYGTGVRDGAIVLDGVDDLVQLPRSIEDDFTVAFWVQTTAVAPGGTDWWQGLGIVDAEVCGSPAGGDWGIALLNGGHVVWGSSANHSSTTEVNDGAWHPVVVTRTEADGIVELWVDGLLEASGVGSPTTPMTAPPWIGLGNNPCDSQSGVQFFPGSIDEVRFYDRLLPDSEARALADDWIFFDAFESGDLSAW